MITLRHVHKRFTGRFPMTQLLDINEPDDDTCTSSDIAQDFGINEETLTRWSNSDETY